MRRSAAPLRICGHSRCEPAAYRGRASRNCNNCFYSKGRSRLKTSSAREMGRSYFLPPSEGSALPRCEADCASLPAPSGCHSTLRWSMRWWVRRMFRATLPWASPTGRQRQFLLSRLERSGLRSPHASTLALAHDSDLGALWSRAARAPSLCRKDRCLAGRHQGTIDICGAPLTRPGDRPARVYRGNGADATCIQAENTFVVDSHIRNKHGNWTDGPNAETKKRELRASDEVERRIPSPRPHSKEGRRGEDRAR